MPFFPVQKRCDQWCYSASFGTKGNVSCGSFNEPPPKREKAQHCRPPLVPGIPFGVLLALSWKRRGVGRQVDNYEWSQTVN